MPNNQNIINIEYTEILEKVSEMKNNNLRLIQISCTNLNGKLEINYTFDNEYNTDNLRINIDNDTEIESIGNIYTYAYLYENEIKDLFGVKLKNMAVDFNGNLYKTAIKTPYI